MTRRKPHADTLDRLHLAAQDMTDIAQMWPRYIAAMSDYRPGIKSALGKGARISSGTGPSDPTGETATNDNHDPLHATHLQILADLAIITTMLERTAAQIRMTAKPNTTARDVKYCANPSCTTVIESPGSTFSLTDRCKPCADYKRRDERNRDAPVRVVQDRERKRNSAHVA